MDVTTVEVASDTCDACPAEAQVQAYVYATHRDWPSGLGYCAHHASQYLEQLRACEATIVDMRHQLHPDTP